MHLKKKLAVAVSCVTLAGWLYGDGDTSAATYVVLDTESTAMWRTAFAPTVTLNWQKPLGATSATLTVKGEKYAQTYANLTGESQAVTLPAASERARENVYHLTLTFDDGTVQTAQVGVVQGTATADHATANCRLTTASDWKVLRQKNVLRVPAGTTALTMDFNTGLGPQAMTTGLSGAEGWFALPRKTSLSPSVDFATTGSECLAAEDFVYAPDGTVLYFR